MSTFQILAIVAALVVIALVLAAASTGRLQWRGALGWALAWAAAAVTIARPGVTVTLANGLGIARGADLVSYLAILAGMVGFFLVFVRLRRLEASITTLVRELALVRVHEPEGEEPGSARKPAP